MVKRNMKISSHMLYLKFNFKTPIYQKYSSFIDFFDLLSFIFKIYFKY